MTTSAVAADVPVAVHVKVTADALVVELRDGRVVSVPVGWYPRLAAATLLERRRWELIGPGIGIHWPAIDKTSPSRPSFKGSVRTRVLGRSAVGRH